VKLEAREYQVIMATVLTKQQSKIEYLPKVKIMTHKYPGIIFKISFSIYQERVILLIRCQRKIHILWERILGMITSYSTV